jgi:hypothetical protein
MRCDWPDWGSYAGIHAFMAGYSRAGSDGLLVGKGPWIFRVWVSESEKIIQLGGRNEDSDDREVL